MTYQSEAALEKQLIKQLQQIGYTFVTLANETELKSNLKSQLEKHNKTTFSTAEFDQIVNTLSKGSVFEKAKTLREKQLLIKDNGDSYHYELLNCEHWCQNQFQVTNQVSQEGNYKNRYDITLLINGLPIIQIELKRRGLELKEAFNQVNRYHRHSFGSGAALFQFLQIFVISNGVNTKYYANNTKQTFKDTFYWTDKENNRQTNILNGFTSEFLEPCHISKMICKYIVLNESSKSLMVLRPYQYYAVETLIDRVINTRKNGYIWHTTGSGKTLTSFKASQVLMGLPEIKKVVFVVDRKDLDYQTIKEFDSFRKGCVDATEHTKGLVEQFTDHTKLIVTTIQKLNTAVQKGKFSKHLDKIKDQRMVFIFDECHRSQFGETHTRIKSYFSDIQMFGFTGTPIFAENSIKNEFGKRTTKELFGECLHKYVITDAIRDENVLKFAVEYVGRYKSRENSQNLVDIEVEDIDTKELLEDSRRLEKIADYVLAHHGKKTHNRTFTAMMCVSSVEVLIKYYEIFRSKYLAGDHNLKIATIFSYTANEEEKSTDGFISEELSVVEEPARALYGLSYLSREKLDEYIVHYNQYFGTKYTTKDSESFYNYYKDISKRVKEKQIDILLVVNMFLTGFDSKNLNTLYVDKNLKYHGLIQAFSRTNRTLNEVKSQGNIVCFRNLKKNTDEAITLFSNKDAIDVIIMEPLEKHEGDFNAAVDKLKTLVPTVDDVNTLTDENQELEFIKAFRNLMRLKNTMSAFADFSWESLSLTEQEFEDYKSKYLDLYDKVHTDTKTEKVSILEDVDFELELIHRDEINVTYILQLLAGLTGTPDEEQKKRRKDIVDLIGGEAKLRSKKELIEKFIEENLPKIQDPDQVQDEFDKFWSEQQIKAFDILVKEENLSPERTQQLIETYLFSEREPIRDEALALLDGEKPKVLQRIKIGDRILKKLLGFVETFIENLN